MNEKIKAKVLQATIVLEQGVECAIEKSRHESNTVFT